MQDRTQKTDGMGRSTVLSLGMHLAIVALAISGGWLSKYLPLGGKNPGTASAGSIEAHLVSKVPGGAIPMPSPVITPTKNRLVSDTKAPGITQPRRRVALKKSVALPSYQPEKLAREQAMRELKKLAQAELKKRDKRVPYGSGGPVSFSATTSTQGAAGGGGMSFGDAAFGSMYTQWVNHLRDRLQFYWNQQPRDPSLAAGSKVTVTMTVHRAGNIDSIYYVQRAASAEVNSMAYNTVQQMSQQETFPLPVGYGKNFLTVTVTFELGQ